MTTRRLPRRPPAAITFPDELPISSHRNEIVAALRDHQVIVVCGATGSGKTTQLPKMCLAAGRGRSGLIGHTQPRRIAARSVAIRIAQELHSKLGEHVGYKMRFADTTSPSTSIKIMTDGILLAEIQADRRLRRYDTLILDEAHERSLNVDFLLGYLKRLLPERPDLRLIITSATIHPQQFAAHFGDAPIIEVSGRGYPVEIRYQPLAAEDAGDRDLQRGILEATETLWRHGPGDILVFLSGEREIRETATFLRRQLRRDCEVLPLFARLSSADQLKIFEKHRRPRLILATNIAETSLTVPGIRYVIDSGLARLSRYNARTKVQRLPVEKISQASAEQRSGRCGRLSPGICIRLFEEEDFLERDEFTTPEILRTNLASVILQMKVMGLGNVQDFPFMDPPDSRAVNEGLGLLRELGAIDDRQAPTRTGRLLSRLPVDPRIGRILLAARDEGCLEQGLVLAAGLSIQDPRERPADKATAADESHENFVDPQSDFFTLLRLWNHFEDRRRELSRRALRDECARSFLHFARMWEWRDVHRQLRNLCREMRGFDPPKGPAGAVAVDRKLYEPVHRALLTGLLSHVAELDGRGPQYRGTQGKTLFLFPGSSLFRKHPRWIVASTLVETTRLYARVCARVEPAWIEAVAEHLVERTHSDPVWHESRGQVMALERVSLGSLVLSADRRAPYDTVDPQRCREIFLADALVPGRLKTRGGFLRANQDLLAALETLEEKSRRRDIVVGENTLLRFYDDRVPAEVVDQKSFERWRSRAERRDPGILRMTRDELLRRAVEDVSAERFPDQWTVGEQPLDLHYRFEPGHPEDGISIRAPLAALSNLEPASFEWLVPGRLADKVMALLRLLPKALRKKLLPLADTRDAFLDHRGARRLSLHASLAEFVERRAGVRLPSEVWTDDRLADDLRMNFQAIDEAGELLDQDRDLDALRRRLGDQTRRQLRELPVPTELDRRDIRAWDFGELPETVESSVQGMRVERFPSLLDRGDGVDLKLIDSADLAAVATRRGVARLLLLALPEQAKLAGRAADKSALSLRWSELPESPWAAIEGCPEPRNGQQEILVATALRLVGNGAVRSAESFYERIDNSRGQFVEQGEELAERLTGLLEKRANLRRALGDSADRAMTDDIETQLNHLLFRGFLAGTPAAWIAHLPRYLQAIEVRLTKARENPEREKRRHAEYAPHWNRLLEQASSAHLVELISEPWIKLRFAHEELRVSIFAQELRTSMPISAKRIEKLWQKLKADSG